MIFSIRISLSNFRQFPSLDGRGVGEGEIRQVHRFHPHLERFVQSGGHIVRFERTEDETKFLRQIEASLLPDVVFEPANPDLRYIHVRKGGYDFYYLTNEGGNPIPNFSFQTFLCKEKFEQKKRRGVKRNTEEKIFFLEGKLTVRSLGYAEWWDTLTGESDQAVILAQNEDSICASQQFASQTTVALCLERRESRVLALNPQRVPTLQPDWKEKRMIQTLDISTGWKLYEKGTEAILAENLIDWTTLEGYNTFSGTVVYEKTLDVTPQILESGTWTLDLGEVHNFAEVFCNGKSCGVRLWGPFRFELPLKPGLNRLRVEVTNSMANRMEGKSLPSGMLGPVVLEQSES